MSSNLLRSLPALLLSLFAFSFSSCGSTGSMLSGPLADALGQVTGLSTNITDWKSSLGGMLEGTKLDQLKDYADQATNLGSSLKSMTSGLSDAMANPLEAISSKLSEMGGINIDSLKSMVPSDQMKVVDRFVDSAGEVSDSTSSFMKQFAK